MVLRKKTGLWPKKHPDVMVLNFKFKVACRIDLMILYFNKLLNTKKMIPRNWVIGQYHSEFAKHIDRRTACMKIRSQYLVTICNQSYTRSGNLREHQNGRCPVLMEQVTQEIMDHKNGKANYQILCVGSQDNYLDMAIFSWFDQSKSSSRRLCGNLQGNLQGNEYLFNEWFSLQVS